MNDYESGRVSELLIQVQPSRVPNLDLDSLKTQCRNLTAALAPDVEFHSEEKDGNEPYLNLRFKVKNLEAVWPELWAALYESKQFKADLRNGSLVVCTGTDHWNDYRLLYHFDPTVLIDSIRPD